MLCVFIVKLWSDRSRIGNAVSVVFRKFLPDIWWLFYVAGVIFGKFG